MYIWILLATIMVALSFFNTSPREDKADVYQAVRATTLVNKFRSHHLAYFRTVECEYIYDAQNIEENTPHNQEYHTGHSVRNDLLRTFPPRDEYPDDYYDTDIELGYTSLSKNLPIGFLNDGYTPIYHRVYCFDNLIVDQGMESETNCKDAKYRYVVSYQQISPDGAFGTSGDEKKLCPHSNDEKKECEHQPIYAPTPEFLTYMGKELAGVKNMGWMWCDLYIEDEDQAQLEDYRESCHLAGRNASFLVPKSDWGIDVSDEDLISGEVSINDWQYTYEKFKFPSVIIKDLLHVCTGRTPCLFTYSALDTTDKNFHCKNLMKAYKFEPPAPTPSPDTE